ncbi:hypothetical protein EJ08DRAFT_732096 [Tothia fuscella]|uniref:Uncharacterized protein n=1 Tax=Tothia fuscella TaxID=1048955 RepID=A0A9P4NXQ8_9PEZI|nr:hypothetical protein EJ08DRAFT_732096 [Tothia fuscella]
MARAANHRFHRFLKLPREMRNLVYHEYLRSEGMPSVKATITRDKRTEDIYDTTSSVSTQTKGYSLLLASKQVHTELKAQIELSKNVLPVHVLTVTTVDTVFLSPPAHTEPSMSLDKRKIRTLVIEDDFCGQNTEVQIQKVIAKTFAYLEGFPVLKSLIYRSTSNHVRCERYAMDCARYFKYELFKFRRITSNRSVQQFAVEYGSASNSSIDTSYHAFRRTEAGNWLVDFNVKTSPSSQHLQKLKRG